MARAYQEWRRLGGAERAAWWAFWLVVGLLHRGALYGSADGLTTIGSQLFTQVGGTVEAGDWFGFTLTTADFNGNGFADLAAGAPIEGVGAIPQAGAVSILQDTATGLTTTGGQLFTQVAGTIEPRDEFGRALAVGDFNDLGFADLAAAAPSETVGTVLRAGAVSALYGTADGLTANGGQIFTQNTPGVPGTAEEEELFGAALATGNPGPAPTATASQAKPR